MSHIPQQRHNLGKITGMKSIRRIKILIMVSISRRARRTAGSKRFSTTRTPTVRKLFGPQLFQPVEQQHISDAVDSKVLHGDFFSGFPPSRVFYLNGGRFAAVLRSVRVVCF